MSRQEKYYLARGMRRAGPILQKHRGDFCVIWVQRSTNRTWLMAHTDTLAITRDAYAFPKALARVTAQCPSEMHVYACNIEEGRALADDIQKQLKERDIITKAGAHAWSVHEKHVPPRFQRKVPLEYAVRSNFLFLTS